MDSPAGPTNITGDVKDGEWAENLTEFPDINLNTSAVVGDDMDLVEILEEDGELQGNDALLDVELEAAPVGDLTSESDLVVLDPDHPLMKRFQTCLKDHLLKQKEKFTLELRELEEGVKTKKNDRENLGVQLYGIQQELARYQMMLEKYHDNYTLTNENRLKQETELSDVRQFYRDVQTAVNAERQKGAELQAQVENIALRLFYMNDAKTDVRSDIAIMKRAAEKADSQVTKAEIEKQKQDLFVNRLVEQVDKIKGEIAMFDAQHIAQTDELKAAKDALMEAYMEIESINVERKQLWQQWNSSLIGMKRRDEAHSAMNHALEELKMRIITLNMEVDGVKKAIGQEQETNEKLTLIHNKTETDLMLVKKQLNSCLTKHDALKAEYSTYTRMLHETEQALGRALQDKNEQQGLQRHLQRQLEVEHSEKLKLEEQIVNKMQEQLLFDKSSQYSQKTISKMREITTSLEQQLADEENKTATESLNITNLNTRLDSLRKMKQEQDDEIDKKNKLVTNSDNEIQRRMMLVERKQTLIDQYNKKLEQLISNTGGAEIGPLELQINSMVKTLDQQQGQITDNQQQWLRRQMDLVKLTKELMEQSSDIESLKKRQMILSQKKIRNENTVEFELKEMSDIERDIRHMRNDIIKLNTLIFKQNGVQEDLERSNLLKENDFITTLKDCEKESLEIQEKLESSKREKDQLLSDLVEAERQIMLWEKKTQLARETKATVDSDVGQGEMRAMKLELHRMEVRYTQLMRQQELLIQDMEKSVSRRDNIVARGDARRKTFKGTKQLLTRGTFERQLLEIRKKIKQTLQNATACDTEITELRSNQRELSDQIEEKQLNCQQLQKSLDAVEADLDKLQEQKQKNLTNLLSKQQKSKYYQQVKEGKYTFASKSANVIDEEMSKHMERLRSLNTAIDRINQEYPQFQPPLRKITLLLQSRSAPEDGSSVSFTSTQIA